MWLPGASLKLDAGDKNYGACLGIFGQKDKKTDYLPGGYWLFLSKDSSTRRWMVRRTRGFIVFITRFLA